MSKQHPIPELDARGLRFFAISTGGIIAVLFGLVFPVLLRGNFPLWPWVLALVLGLWGVAAPSSLRGIYRAWMHFGLALNRIVTPLVLGVIFYLVVTPTALVMRLAGRDAMRRAFDKNADTYRVKSEKPPAEKMERPF